MAVDVSKIPNNNKFDPVREAILKLQQDVTDGVAGVATVNSSDGNITITNSGTITVGTVGETITIGIDDSTYLTSADLSDYLSLSETGLQTIAGDITISGDLTVSGTTTYINTNHLNIGDNIITLNADLPATTAPSENAGIEINRGSSPTVDFLWNETSNEWDLQTYSGARIYRYGVGSTALTIEAGSTAGDAIIALTPNTTGLGGVIRTTNARPIAFQPNSTTKVIIASDGNMNVYEKLAVGKTTAASTYPLEVDGAVLAQNFKAQMTASGTTYTGTIDQYNNSMQIRTDAGGAISLGGSGTGSVQNNVYIKNGDLDVNGDVTADNFIGDGSQLTNLPGGSDTLQDVTDNGATTTNDISFTKSSGTTYTPLTLGLTTSGASYVKQDFITDTISSTKAFLIAYGSGNGQDGSFAMKNTSSHTTTNGTAGDIWFATGASSTERMRIKGDGKIGIGTSTPSVKLDIKDSSSGEFTALNLTNTFDDNNASSNPLVSMWLNAASNNGYLRVYGAPADTASKHQFDIGSTAGSSFITFSTSADEKMRIANDGKVGIGTDAPTDKLQIDAPNSQLRLRDTDDGTFTQFSSSGNLLAIRQNSTTASHFWMNSSGNVGIGTSSPSQKLDVNGSVNVGSGIVLLGQNRIDGSTDNFKISADHSNVSGSSTIEFLVDGSEKMRINNLGNVGIGTTSPSDILVVHKDSTSGQIVTHRNNTGYFLNRTYADYNNDGVTVEYQERIGVDGNKASIGTYSGHDLSLRTNNTDRIYIQSTGNVGIGTTSPTTGKLVVHAGDIEVRDSTGNSGGRIKAFDNYHAIYFREGGQNRTNYYQYGGTLSAGLGHRFLTGGTSQSLRMQIADDGIYMANDVGIGTTSPRYQLDLAIPQDSSQADYIALGVKNGPSTGDGTSLGCGLIWKTNYSGYTKRSAGIVQIAEGNYFRSGLAFYTNGTANTSTDWVQRMYLSSGGILQINRTNGQPTIKGSTTTGSAHLIIDSASGGDAVFLQNYNSGNVYMVTGGGAVGIGTTSPSSGQKLDVQGNELLNGSLYLGNTTTRISSDGSGEVGINYNSGNTSTYSLSIYNSYSRAIGLGRTGDAFFSGNVGINTTSPQVKLEVRGDILRSSIRVSDSRRYPVGRFNEGEQVFGIDPTWSQNELRQFFNSNNVSWNADSTAPGGYAIYINGGVNVGGQYTSGFPYIPVDQDDYFYMEVWIRNAGSGQTHYMGSNEYNENFSSLGGHPGSFGYWVMSNTNPGSSWTKVSGYIGGFSASTVGTFENGTKYWTPMALFNYGAGSGTRACYISGWKVFRVTQHGRRKFTGAVGVLGGSYSASVDSVSDAGLVVKQGRKIYSLANSDQYLRNLIQHTSSNHIVIGQLSTSLIGDIYLQTGSSGNVKFYTDGTETMRLASDGDLHVQSDVIAYSSTVSDARLKDDVLTIDNALDKVKALRGVEYVWNKGGREGQKDLGFIAQEVEQVIPEIVREKKMPLLDDTSKEYKTVDYEKVVAVLVEAMKEQQKQIDELKARLDGSTY